MRCLLLTVAFGLIASIAVAETSVTSGSQLAYEICGRGEHTIVLLHDGIADAAVWDEVWPALCKDNRVIRYDRRGYGHSPKATEPHSPTADLAALLARLGIQRCVLIGASAGGGMTFDFALEHPNIVERLVLVAPSITGFPRTAAFETRTAALGQAILKGDIEAGIAAVVTDPHFIAPGRDDAKRHLTAILRASPQDLAPHPFQTRPMDSMSRVARMQVPTLILIGTADDDQNIGQAAALQKGLPNGKRVSIQKSGHLIYLDQPRAFVKAVRAFLR